MDRRHSAGTWSSEVIASTGQASMHELSLVPIHGSLITYTTPTTHAVAAVRPVDRSQGSRGHRGARRTASGCIAVACEYTSSASRPPGSSNADARPRCAPGRATLGRSARVRSPTGSDPHAYAELAGWLARERDPHPSRPPTRGRDGRAQARATAGRRRPRSSARSARARDLRRAGFSAPSALHRGPHVCFELGTAPTAPPCERTSPSSAPHTSASRKVCSTRSNHGPLFAHSFPAILTRPAASSRSTHPVPVLANRLRDKPRAL